MSKKSQSAGSLAWKGICVTCKGCIDCLYTICVLALSIVVAFVATVAMLDEIPIPTFIVDELESQLEDKGASLNVNGIRFHPNGTILLDRPSIVLKDFNTTIAQAKSASARLSIPLLLLGKVRIIELAASGGEVLSPAILSPSGISEPVIESIDFALKRHGSLWEAEYGEFEYGNLRLFLSGRSDLAAWPYFDQPTEQRDLRKAFIESIPQLWKGKELIEPYGQIDVAAHLSGNLSGPQLASVSVSLPNAVIENQIEIDDILIHLSANSIGDIRVDAELGAIEAPQNIRAERIELSARWDDFPKKDNPYPQELRIALAKIQRESVSIPGLCARLKRIGATSRFLSETMVEIASKPWQARATIDIDDLSATAAVSGLVGPDIIGLASAIHGQDLSGFARISNPIDLEAHIVTGPKFALRDTHAQIEAAALDVLGTHFDYASSDISFSGTQFAAERTRIRAGPYEGDMDFYFNTGTNVRRILFDGQIDPKIFNGWFASWWKEFWDNFDFKSDGIYCAMDSQGIYLKPTEVNVSGIGWDRTMDIRGEAMEELRLRFYILFRYFDLFDIELERKEGSLQGETQFAIDRDPVDSKDKLTAIWIDANTNIDLHIGPTVLYEIGDATARILEPYSYETPPFVIAKAASAMRDGAFDYDIDLQIDSAHDFAFENFPFEHVSAHANIDNQQTLVTNIEAGIGGGSLTGGVSIVDDHIDLTARLAGADFGKALVASATYFATNDPEDEEPVDENEFLAYGGIIEMEFIGSGKQENMFSYEGKGTYEISDANLATTRLLGDLSAIIPGTTFKFSDSKGSFIAKKRYLEFPDTVVAGPMSGINAAGIYDMEEDAMDFKVRVSPYRHSKNPFGLLSGIATLPLTQIFQLHLTGSIDEWKWSLFGGSEAPTAPPQENDPDTDAEPTR